MKTKYFLPIGFLFLSISQATLGQETSKDSVTSAENAIKTVENIINKLPQIDGFVNLRYQAYENNGIGQDGFDVRRAYFGLTGNAAQNLTYRFLSDFAGTPKILDAYAVWKPNKYIGLQAGQFKVPYTLENPIAQFYLETVDNSQVITALVTTLNGTNINGRDIGVALNGSLFFREGYNLIDYKLGVFNGNGINVTDNNTYKDIVGTLLINPIKPLNVGLSYYKGEYGPQATKYKRNRASYGIKYDDGKLLVRSEYIDGTTNITKAYGYYVTAGYFVTQKLQPVLKYDFYQSDTSKSTTPITNYVAGLNYWIGKVTRVQLSLERFDYKNPAIKNYNYIVAQTFIGF